MKNNAKALLSIKNASYQYSDAEEGEYALRDVSYDFEKGKVYAIRGRSGTGKTTLLSLISGLERCTEGDIIFDGKNLRDINLDYYRSHDIDTSIIWGNFGYIIKVNIAKWTFVQKHLEKLFSCLFVGRGDINLHIHSSGPQQCRV